MSRDRTGAAAQLGAAVTGLIAFTLVLAGALLLWANGHYRDADGFFSTGSERFASSGYAVTTNELRVGDSRVLSSDRYGTIRVSAAPREGKPLFVGIARTRDVEAYLRGAPHSEVSDVDFAPFHARYTTHDGTRPPGRPGDRRIWAARAARELTWDVRPGDWSVVVMNADGSRSVAAGVSAGAKVPYLSALGFGALGIGLAFVAATAALTLYGTRPPARRLVPA